MEQTQDHSENNEMVPHLKSLALCLNKMVLEGYDDDFKVEEDSIMSIKTNKTYTPDQIKVVNFFRFEGQSDPNDMSIMYVIETSDGIKGTVVDAYGPYADRNVGEFFKKVDDMHKKTHSRSHSS